MKLTNSERYLALMRLAAHYGAVELQRRGAAHWAVVADDNCSPLLIGTGPSMDEAVDEAARAFDARPIRPEAKP